MDSTVASPAGATAAQRFLEHVRRLDRHSMSDVVGRWHRMDPACWLEAECALGDAMRTSVPDLPRAETLEWLFETYRTAEWKCPDASGLPEPPPPDEDEEAEVLVATAASALLASPFLRPAHVETLYHPFRPYLPTAEELEREEWAGAA